MNNKLLPLFVAACFFSLSLKAGNTEVANPPVLPAPLTPPTPATPRINGPGVFGVRPGSPVLYSIPATGDRPMSFAADGLPASLSLDPNTGRITGVLKETGSYTISLD